MPRATNAASTSPIRSLSISDASAAMIIGFAEKISATNEAGTFVTLTCSSVMDIGMRSIPSTITYNASRRPTGVFLFFRSSKPKGSITNPPMENLRKLICKGPMWGISFETTSRVPNTNPVKSSR